MGILAFYLQILATTHGEYKYNLDAGWDGKNDIADFIAAYNWYFNNGAFETENKPSVVPTYLCNVNNFNNCSRPNCCDANPVMTEKRVN